MKIILCLVCEDNNNQVLGFIDGEVIEPSIVYYDKVAFLNHICVDKKYRRKGIGDLLFLAFQDEVAKQNAKYIRVLAFPQTHQQFLFIISTIYWNIRFIIKRKLNNNFSVC